MGQDETPPWELPGTWDEGWSPVQGGAKGSMSSLGAAPARLPQASTFKELARDVQEDSDGEEQE